NGEPPAQASNGGLVLGTGVARRGDLKARIAEEAMDDFAERLAGLEIGNNGGVKLKGASLDHTSRGSVAQRHVARERDRIIIPRPFRYRVQSAIARRITVGLEAALLPDLRKPGVRRRNASEGAVGPHVRAFGRLRQLPDQCVLVGMSCEHLVQVSTIG